MTEPARHDAPRRQRLPWGPSEVRVYATLTDGNGDRVGYARLRVFDHERETPWYGFASVTREFVARGSSEDERDDIFEKAKGGFSLIVFKNVEASNANYLERAVRAAEVALARANLALDAARGRRSQ